MRFFQISIGIFLVLAASRFVPHPPNFTSLLAVSFYIPALLGRKYIFSVITCFILTDLIIGFHSTTLFTWGSVGIIGYVSHYFLKSVSTRILGAVSGTLIFFIVSNFGVWASSILHGNNTLTLLETYVIAIPFYGNTLFSTIIFSFIIEGLISLKKIKLFLRKI